MLVCLSITRIARGAAHAILDKWRKAQDDGKAAYKTLYDSLKKHNWSELATDLKHIVEKVEGKLSHWTYYMSVTLLIEMWVARDIEPFHKDSRIQCLVVSLLVYHCAFLTV